MAGPAKDLDGAATLAQDLVTKGDADSKTVASSYRVWGNILGEQNKLDEAIRRYQNALQLDPDDPLTYNNLGVVLAKQNHRPESIAAFQKAVHLAPKLAFAHYNMANALVLESRLEEADKEYQAAVSADPNFSDAWNVWGVLEGQRKQYRSASAKYETAIRRNPRLAMAYYNLGNLQSSALGQPEDAARQYETALFLQPTLAPAWLGWGLLLENQCDLQGALEKYAKASSLDSQSAQAHINIGNVQAKLRQIDAAIRSYRDALQVDPNSLDARSGLQYVLSLSEVPDAPISNPECTKSQTGYTPNPLYS